MFFYNVFRFSDGTDFKKYEGYYCKSFFKTEKSLVDAISECRQNVNCSMVSTSNCRNASTGYRLCEQSTELIPSLEACYHWKKGNFLLNQIVMLVFLKLTKWIVSIVTFSKTLLQYYTAPMGLKMGTKAMSTVVEAVRHAQVFIFKPIS